MRDSMWDVLSLICLTHVEPEKEVRRSSSAKCCYRAQGTVLQILWSPVVGKNLKRNICACVCVAESLCCTPETNTL